MVTGIGLAIVIVALFWILYIYAVRRGRFLVRMQLGSFPEQRSEDAKTAPTASADQPVEIDAFSRNIKTDTKIEPFGKKRRIPQKRPVSADERRWAIPN
jgi:hypothetical protein